MKIPEHCPVAGAGARMTRDGFAMACARERRALCGNAHVVGRHGFRQTCDGCEIGAAVEDGRDYPPPARVKFVTLARLCRDRG